MLRVLCAPDSFKGSLTALQVAQAMGRGVVRAGRSIEADVCPVADGGEGTLDAIIPSLDGEIKRATVTGPLGLPVEARYGIAIQAGTAVVEMAEASGLMLVPPSQRDPSRTTSFGTGQLIAAAIDAGCRSIIVCIGGSATNDGAAGMVQALGGRFFDGAGRLIEEPLTGGRLPTIARFQPPPPSELPRILVACDVNNPLCGPDGAAATYGPQKGATPEQVEELDHALAHLASVVGGPIDTPGYGAAGGAGFGLAAMCRAELRRGVDLVLEAVGFADRCTSADLVLTGEGRLDSQSLHGKTCLGVAKMAAEAGVKTIAIVGRADPATAEVFGPGTDGPLAEYHSLAGVYGEDRAMSEPEALISELAEQAARRRLEAGE